jgi:signal transduction histidine kinase
MNQRTASRVAWSVWGVTVVLVGLFPLVTSAGRTGDAWHDLLLESIAILGFATIGALTWSRQPRNPIGLILSWIGFASAAGSVAGAYAKWGIDVHAGIPLATAAAWVGRTMLPAFLVALPLIFLLFPTGTVPSPRWRPVLWVLIGAIVVNVLLTAVTPGSLSSGFIELHHAIPNPLGLPMSWRSAVVGVTGAAGVVALLCTVLALISLFLRYRRAVGEERQQIRWLAFVAALALVIGLALVLINIVRAVMGVHVTDDDPVGNTVFIALVFLAVLGVPAACGIAILRYHLWDLDIVVRKAALYLILAGLLLAAGLFVAIVANALISILAPKQVSDLVAGVVLGLLFWPLRRLATRIADRVVYGGRASPYEVLTAFAENAGETYGTEEVLPRMAQVLAQAVGARTARVWLYVDRELRPAAAWPVEEPPPAVRVTGEALPNMAPDHAVEVRDGGELLGALSVLMPANDPMSPAKDRLVRDLAGQAGLVLRNVRLIEELRASRQRLVAAQDQERRRIERNIHDGAQQQLVALQVKLGLVRRMTDGVPGPANAAIDQLQQDAQQALEDLRDLARGIYPPLLADQGLRAAVEAQVRRSPVPVRVEVDGVDRYAPEVEAAVYFSILEALQNVAKYAHASAATVKLSNGSGTLDFQVVDDGVGFDAVATTFGTGLRGMADRVAAIGGTLEVRAAPGAGTRVVGRVPASARGET